MNLDLAKIIEWLVNNKLVLNVAKTNAMFLSKIKVDKLTFNNSISISNTLINFVNNIKLLGVQIDDELNFDSHINNICKKINKKSYLLNQNKKLFSLRFKVNLIKLFIIPNFEYCSTLFSVRDIGI